LLGVGFLTFAITTLSDSPLPASQDHQVNAGIKGRFVGAWRLAWLEEEGADGKI
jgi:hypothetical protein